MNKTYISLNLGSQSKQIFMISYTKDGGFLIKDLMRLNAQDKKCLISKFATDTDNHGIRTVDPSYRAFTSGEAKLTHHFDGRAHISGEGVVSGYNEDGTSKGAGIKSFALTSNNDGGPVFGLLAWGCEKSCRDSKANDIILILDSRHIHSAHANKDLNGYVVKGFYILKSCITPNNPIPPKVIYHNPIEGNIEVTIVPSPDNVPGVIGLLATPSNHGFKDEFGFTLSGAPGQIYDKHFCDCLSIIYPFQESSKDYKNLDYNEEGSHFT